MKDLQEEIGKLSKEILTGIAQRFDEDRHHDVILGVGSNFVGAVLADIKSSAERERLIKKMNSFMADVCMVASSTHLSKTNH